MEAKSPEAMLPGQDEAAIDAALERLVFAVVGITSSVLERHPAARDLTFVQWRVLVIVGSYESGVRVGDVAARIGATGSATSRLLRRMERHELVTTVRDDQDRRATIVRLGCTGREIRTAVVRERRDLVGALLRQHGRPLPLDLAPGLEAIADAFGGYA